MAAATFTYETFITQARQAHKLSRYTLVLARIPHLKKHQQALQRFRDLDLTPLEKIVDAMTPEERTLQTELTAERKEELAAAAQLPVAKITTLESWVRQQN